MKKLVLTTLAACVSMAFASAYADSTTGKEPIRLAQAAPKSGDDATNVPAQKPKDRKVREGSGSKTPSAKSGDEGSGPTGSSKERKSKSEKEMAKDKSMDKPMAK